MLVYQRVQAPMFRARKEAGKRHLAGNSVFFCREKHVPWVELPLTNFEDFHVVQTTTEIEDLKHV